MSSVRDIIRDAITRIARKSCRNGEAGIREWPSLYSLPHAESWDIVGDKYVDEIMSAIVENASLYERTSAVENREDESHGQ